MNDDDLTYTVKLDSIDTLDDCIPVSYEAGSTVGGPSTITLTGTTNDDLTYTFDTTYAGEYDKYIDPQQVENMCEEYPALQKVWRNFKSLYDMTLQDYKGKQKAGELDDEIPF